MGDQYVIEHWTDEQLQEHKQKYPQAKGVDGPSVLRDSDGLIMGFYVDEDSAKAAKHQLDVEEAIAAQFEDFVHRVSEGYKLTVGQVQEIVSSYLRGG